MKCKKGFKVEALHSAAGYYIGTLDEFGCPNCRLTSEYAKTAYMAEDLTIDREYAMENSFCNCGEGCGLCNEPNIKEWIHTRFHEIAKPVTLLRMAIEPDLFMAYAVTPQTPADSWIINEYMSDPRYEYGNEEPNVCRDYIRREYNVGETVFIKFWREGYKAEYICVRTVENIKLETQEVHELMQRYYRESAEIISMITGEADFSYSCF